MRRWGRQAGAAAVTHYDGDDDQTQRRKGRRLFQAGLVIVILSLISGLMTYFVLTGLTPISPTNEVVRIVWLINGVLISAMIGIVAWQIIGLWRARQRQAAGAGLHVRIVGLFSVVALFPAILLAVFASESLDRGLDQWFSDRTKTIIRDSVDVANAYLEEHGKSIRADAIGMASDLENAAQLMDENPKAFQGYAAALAVERRLPYAFLVNSKGEAVVEVFKSAGTPFFPPPPDAITAAADGRIVDAGLTVPGGGGAIRF